MNVLRILPVLLLAISLVEPRSGLASEAQDRPLTVEDSIESMHLLYPGEQNEPALISPDGRKFLVLLEHGDVARNGTWVELLVGGVTSVQTASQARIVTRLFSRSTARASDLIKDVRWLSDNRRLTFLWDGGGTLPKIVSVNTLTGQSRTLLRHSTPIAKYDIGGHGYPIIFLAESRPNRVQEAALRRGGFAVTDQSLSSILRGRFDGWTPGCRYETFMVSRPGGKPRRIREPNSLWSTPPELIRLAPNARYAVLVRPAAEVPSSWEAYTEHVFRDIYLPAAREHPGSSNYIRQVFVVDLKKAIAQPLWNAPENPMEDVVWAPDSRQVLIGPTFLPIRGREDIGLSGQDLAVVDILSSKFNCLPLPKSSRSYYRPVRWRNDGVVEITGVDERAKDDSETLRFKEQGGKWISVDQEYGHGRRPFGVQVELRQDPNTPPALYARSARGVERLIWDLNPKLRREVTLARVETVHWDGVDGKAWTGMMYYPVHYQAGRTFPLVIQTHGYSAQQFSLDGSFPTAFAAQMLANRDIAVLQAGGPDAESEDLIATPAEPQVYSSGFEGAIEHFVELGLADPQKIGIIGFSRTGWIVEYMLTHSPARLAAAEVADNIDGSYLQYVMDSDQNRVFEERGNGARPFGKGLETWARMAPGFNADRVHTPLRIEVDSGPVDEILSAWEMFSNLRYLHKPVELFVIPDIWHGAHILQIPRQRLASQGGTVDWFCFWLKGEEDAEPHKTDQYARWHQLKNLLNHENSVGTLGEP